MNDALEIANVKARYCAAVDLSATDPRAAQQNFKSIFANDIIAEYGYGPVAGIDAVIAFLCTAIAGNSEWSLHMLHTPDIEVNGDQASGRWTVSIHSKRRADGKIEDIFARYADSYIRTPEGWRIATTNFSFYA